VKLTKTQQRIVVIALDMEPEPFSPTQMGMALGYQQVSASSRMVPHIRRLMEEDAISKKKLGHNKVEYHLTDMGRAEAQRLKNA